MNTLATRSGQPSIWDRLTRTAQADRLAHAYLFAGDASARIEETAVAFAAFVNCPSFPASCGVCASCERILTDGHPDVVILRREGAAKIIPINAIRTQIISRTSTQPHEAKTRVFIIEEATALQDAAANSLLKTLEEPPTQAIFILLTRAPQQLLSTIRSRCQMIAFPSLRAAGSLDADDDISETQSEQLAAQLLDVARTAKTPQEVLASLADVDTERTQAITLVRTLARVWHQRVTETLTKAPDRAHAMTRGWNDLYRAEIALVLHNANGRLTLESLLTSLARHRPKARAVA